MDEVAVEIPGQVWKKRMISDYDFQHSHPCPQHKPGALLSLYCREIKLAMSYTHPSIHPPMISSVLGIR